MRIFGFRSHGGPEVLELLDVPAPTPGPGQVLIDVLATAVNPGDLNTREGTNGWEVNFPMAFGREAAGRVVGTGELVESLGARHLPKGRWPEQRPDAVFDLVGGDTLREAAGLGAPLVSVADYGLVEKLGGRNVPRRRTREVFAEVARHARVIVGEEFPLERAAEAVALVEDGHATGKVVVTVG